MCDYYLYYYHYLSAVFFFRVVNLCVTQLLDTVLGLILMYILMTNHTAQRLANICLANGDVGIQAVKKVLLYLGLTVFFI